MDDEDPVRGRAGRPQLLAGVFMASAASDTDDMYVVPDDLNDRGPKGPVVWTPYPGAGGPVLPSRNDRAYLMFADDGTPVVVLWTP